MTTRKPVLQKVERHGSHKAEYYWFWCPGCEQAHQYTVNPINGSGWTFNGSMESPTFTPSLLCRYGENDPRRCHLYLTDGKLQFLSDCSHPLAGQTVPLPELPDWMLDFQ